MINLSFNYNKKFNCKEIVEISDKNVIQIIDQNILALRFKAGYFIIVICKDDLIS